MVLKFLIFACLLILAPITAIAETNMTTSNAATESFPLDQIQSRVESSVRALPSDSKMIWTGMVTPPLPDSWPPTPTTVWVRYGYARGQEIPLRIADGEQVSKVLFRIEIVPTDHQGKLNRIGERVESAGIQGVRPLRPDEVGIFKNADSVQTAAQALKAMPASAQSTEIKAYYQLWMQTNGVIAGQVEKFHAAFFAWLKS